MSDLVRISKLLSQRQMCSRREADELIEKGWVIVNGQPAELGQKASEQAKISISEKGLAWLNKKYTVLLYKPVGYVSAQAEDGYTPAIELIQNKSFVGENNPFKSDKDLRGMAPAGRLDIDSKGLLILTQDGTLAKAIINHDSKVSKEYIVKVDAAVTPSQIKQLSHGLEMDGKVLKKALIKLLNPSLLNISLWEGKKRQIRRMCEAVDLKVLSLKRIRVGNLKLGLLEEGQWRLITEDEKTELLKMS